MTDDRSTTEGQPRDPHPADARAPLERWLAEPPPADVQQALERLRRGQDVARVAVMPDVHLSSEGCVGVALATRSTLVPAAVGGDIGCGMAALAFETSASVLDSSTVAARLLDGLYRVIPVMRNERRSAPPLPPALAERELQHPALRATRAHEAPLQFGTLGRGNHFLELQSDEDDRLWLMVHSGSRAIGTALKTDDMNSRLASPGRMPKSSPRPSTWCISTPRDVVNTHRTSVP